MSKKENIGVTGGTGFVGSHLLYYLTKEGNKVNALKRKNSSVELTKKIFLWHEPDSLNLFNQINWVNGDVTDLDSLNNFIKPGMKLYHTAGLVSFNPEDKEKLMEINQNGTANVVNVSLDKKIEKLCFVSSIAAVGRDNSEPLTSEETPWDNRAKISNYAISKHEAEREVWRGIAEGLNAVIVNPTIILGPGDWNKGSVKMFQKVYSGLSFYTPGKNGYVDVEDLVKIMILLENKPISGERFIINSENVTYKDLFTWMAEGLNVKPPKYKAGKFLSEAVWRIDKIKSLVTRQKPLITKETARTAQQSYEYSNAKIITATGYQFKPLKQTLKETGKIFLNDVKKS